MFFYLPYCSQRYIFFSGFRTFINIKTLLSIWTLLKNYTFYIPFLAGNGFWQGFVEEELGDWSIQFWATVQVHTWQEVGTTFGYQQEAIYQSEIECKELRQLELYHQGVKTPLTAKQTEQLTQFIIKQAHFTTNH
jgi:hypothetical protein